MTRKTCCFPFMLIGFVALGVLMTGGCGNSKKQPEDTFVIHGKLKNTNGEKIVLVQMKTDSVKPIDSMMIDDNGEFRFSYKPAGICFYMLKLADDNFITLLLNKGENVEITGNSRQLASEYKVVGSAGSELLSQLNDHTRMNFKKSDSLLGVLEANKDSVDFIEIKAECDSMYDIIFADQQEYVKSFIQKNPYFPGIAFCFVSDFRTKKSIE